MIDWQQIDTVFLDMDGTLLDLHFDNYFWLSHLPERYAEHKSLPLARASEKLDQLIRQQAGTLNWYCLDFWTETLGLDIPQMKEEVKHLIAFRPHVEYFLEELQRTHHRVVLVTNAHNKSLNLKLGITRLDRFVDAIICSHDLGIPKEDVAFWHALQKIEPYNPDRTLFIDDSIHVLKAAREYGVRYLYTILQPDSQQPERKPDGPDFVAIDKFKDLIRHNEITSAKIPSSTAGTAPG
ncbi:MAG: haloacid dehalogenase [Proteobacteria bacterium]|nr:MAG: haloacid dehalogenase [Pseudomonadota bacterium]